MKKKFLLIFLFLFLGISAFYVYNSYNKESEILQDITVEDIERMFSKNISSSNAKQLVAGSDLIPDRSDEATARNNTINLQKAIDEVSNAGGGNVYLPAGTYYFAKGGVAANGEIYVIRCRNNVHLIGAGTKENDRNRLTVLKPIYNNPNSVGGMDMFYFNNYADTGFNANYSYPTLGQVRDVSYHDINGNLQVLRSQTVYLINADFSNFVIDAAQNNGGTYTTSGKGFMINLFANCDWNNIVVKNTDATGFGMDCPINSTIKNSYAINCGKKATELDGGASGFGIGVGVSNMESMLIENCYAIHNKKYGFFFEDQARFNPNAYKATKSLGFVVSNSQAGGNLYDFGGLKAYDVIYQYNKSISGMGSYSYYNQRYDLSRNKKPVNFSLYSVNSRANNNDFSSYFNDINNYREQIVWAVNNGYISPINANTFGYGNVVTREEIISILYSYKGYEGNVNVRSTDNDQKGTLNDIRNRGGFGDVVIPDKRLENDNNNAILWGIDKGILSRDSRFRGSDICSRAEFFVMLYRLAGSPRVSGTVPFTDVAAGSWYYNAVVWAYANQITNGKSTTSFAPTDKITKTEVAIALFRYNKLNSGRYTITYNYLGGTGNNKTSYTPSDSPFTLSNPSRSGYTFLGWTGSNGNTPSKFVTIPTNSTGNLVYVANWESDIVSIAIKSNPTVMSYKVGDMFNPEGLVLEVFYGDGSSSVVTNGFTLSNVDMSRAGTKKVTVRYGDKTTEFMIDVRNKDVLTLQSIRIDKLPKTNYYVGESIDTTGLTLVATYSDGSTRKISAGYEVSQVSLDTVGTKKVTVKYDGKETSYDVVVRKRMENITISKIEIESLPSKVKYNVGDSLSTKGLSLRVTYSDGAVKIVNSGFTVGNVNLNSRGTKKVTIKYEGKTVTYDIYVSELQVAEISIISLPERLVYYVGDTYTSDGLVLGVKYSNGETTEVRKNYETSIVSGSTLSIVGETRVVVTYGGKKTYYTINVINKNKESMIVSRYPFKTEYYLGEILDLSGLELKYVDSNGKVEIISSGYESSIPDKTTLMEPGNIRIKIRYGNFEFDIDIVVLTIKSLEIKADTLQTTYAVGDTFNADDIVLIANCSDGKKREISKGYEVSIPQQYVFDNKGSKEVTITYGDKKVTTSVKVASKKVSDDYIVIGIVSFLMIAVLVLAKKDGIIQVVNS